MTTAQCMDVSWYSRQNDGKTYHPDEDYPRPKYEHREDSRDEGHRRLLWRAEGVCDSRLRMVMDFLWVRDNGL